MPQTSSSIVASSLLSSPESSTLSSRHSEDINSFDYSQSRKVENMLISTLHKENLRTKEVICLTQSYNSFMSNVNPFQLNLFPSSPTMILGTISMLSIKSLSWKNAINTKREYFTSYQIPQNQ